jgi:hypothetical protein
LSTDPGRYTCEHHGQIIEEYVGSDEDFESGLSDYQKFSIINRRTRVTAPSNDNNDTYRPLGHEKSKKRKTNIEQSRILEGRPPFAPCSHIGPCDEASDCSCIKNKVQCEKSCGCMQGCDRRFRGCRCAQKSRLCSNEKCPCFLANRECDPDLCGKCGVTDVLDPINRNQEAEWLDKRCRNCYIQRGIPKRTLIGTSTIHGFGLFVGEDVKAKEFIGEYKGEIIGRREGDRRGTVDLYREISYLFTVNPGTLFFNRMHSIVNKLGAQTRT